MSRITTHVLDTSSGKPAEGIRITLTYFKDDAWSELAAGVTNKDGRITDLISDKMKLDNGIYKMNFETGVYFKGKEIKNFYPYIEIVFEIRSDEHYHIPLLLSPFGYTTYRGS